MGSFGRRSMSTVAKAVEEITGTGNTKIRKSSSELCTFLGIPRQSRSEIALILSKFTKLYNFKSPGIKKDKIWEQNLQTLLRGRNNVGFPEIAKILSPEFGHGAINVKDSSIGDSSGDATKGKGPKKKGTSSKK
uniref:DM2 domain-containing protein n=1 Tax=Glycine max TaxID=3847 RepID=C6SY72_SOYBN|nr:unknown [Glycine max]